MIKIKEYMLISEEAHLKVKRKSIEFRWRYKGRIKSYLLDKQVLNSAKLIKSDYKKPVVAIWIKQGQHYKVTDLLLAAIPLDTPLEFFKSQICKDFLTIVISDGVQNWSVQISTESLSFKKIRWAMSPNILKSIKISVGKEEFNFYLEELHLPTTIKSSLSNFEPAHFGYIGSLCIQNEEGEDLQVPCKVSQPTLWRLGINGISKPNSAKLNVRATWSKKLQHYETVEVEPVLIDGEYDLFLVAIEQKANATFWLLESELPNIAGIIFSCFKPKYASEIIEFKCDSEVPFIIRVKVWMDGDKQRLKPLIFLPYCDPPLLANVLTAKDIVTQDVYSKEMDEDFILDMQGFKKGKICFRTSFYIPRNFEIGFSEDKPTLIPMAFSDDKPAIFPLFTKNPDEKIEGVFLSEGMSEELPSAHLFSRLSDSHSLFFRIEINELLRFGIVRIKPGVKIKMAIVGRTAKPKGIHWEIVEISTNLNSMISNFNEINAELVPLCSWSCIPHSTMSQYDYILDSFYKGGAFLVANQNGDVKLALPLSAGLLKKANYYNITSSTELTLDYTVSIQKSPQRFSSVCTRLRPRVGRADDDSLTVKYVERDPKKSNIHYFKVKKETKDGPSVDTPIRYTEPPNGGIPLFNIPKIDKAIFTVTIRRFRTIYIISKIIKVELCTDE